MSNRLRWSVFWASSFLVALSAPDCWRVLTEELERPLLPEGRPLAASGRSRASIDTEHLALRAVAPARASRADRDDSAATARGHGAR